MFPKIRFGGTHNGCVAVLSIIHVQSERPHVMERAVRVSSHVVHVNSPHFTVRANILRYSLGGSPGELREELVTWEKRKKGWKLNCDVGEATEGLENELFQF